MKKYGVELINEIEKKLQSNSNDSIKYIDSNIEEVAASNYYNNIDSIELKKELEILNNKGVAEATILIDIETNRIISSVNNNGKWLVETSEGNQWINPKLKKYSKYFREEKRVLPIWVKTIYNNVLGSAPQIIIIPSNLNYYTGEYKKINELYY